MERRTKLLILLVIALGLLVFGLWYLFAPLLPRLSQPPALPERVTPSTELPPEQGTVAPPVVTEEQKDSMSLRQLANFVSIFVARMGSGTSAEGFQGYADVMLNATPAYAATLRAEQQALRRAHPADGPRFNVLTRVVSVDTRGTDADAAQTQVTLQLQRAEDTDDASKAAVSYKQAVVEVEKQANGAYLVSNVTFTDVQL